MWSQQGADVEGRVVDLPPAKTVKCKDFSAYMSNDPEPPTSRNTIFSKGDIICDNERVFECIQPLECEFIRPSISVEEGIPGWNIKRAFPELEFVKEREWPKPEIPTCMPDDYKVSGSWTDKDWEDVENKVFITNGQQCSPDLEYQRKSYSMYIDNIDVTESIWEQEHYPPNFDVLLHSITEEEIDYIFPYRYGNFDLFAFVRNAINFQGFCSEVGKDSGLSRIQGCRRELAIFFTFIGMGSVTEKIEDIPAWQTGLMKIQDELCFEY